MDEGSFLERRVGLYATTPGLREKACRLVCTE